MPILIIVSVNINNLLISTLAYIIALKSNTDQTKKYGKR